MGNRRRRWRPLGALLGSVVMVSGAPADEGNPGSSQTNLVKQANAWQDARPFLSCWTGGRTVRWAKRKGLRVTLNAGGRRSVAAPAEPRVVDQFPSRLVEDAAMSFALSISLVAVGLFAAMLLVLELGRRIGARRLAALPPGTSWEIGTLDGAVFALLGLLIAFTFSGAVTRFEARRHLVVEETNAIGTAYLRLDLLPVAAQPALRDALRRYLDARLEVYRSLPDLVAAKQALARSVQIQGEIWRGAVAACRADPTSSTTMLVLGALNAMIDITTTRTMVAENHPPAVIFLMLFGLALASALLAGHGMAGRPRSWIHVIGFAAAIATAAFVTLDIEFPRLGLIRVDSFDRALIELRSGMQ